MKLRIYISLITVFFIGISSYAQDHNSVEKHIPIINEEGRFSGWPANKGIWSWDNEILVGFVHGSYAKNPTGGHDIDSSKGSQDLLARSMDGGETWTIEQRIVHAPKTEPLQKGYNFKKKDIALNFRGNTWFISHDRGKNWTGPYTLPTYGRPGLLARTDYIIEGPKRVTAFVAAAKTVGDEGQTLCIRTKDGGVTWNKIGWIGTEPPDDYGYAIMPATIRIKGDGYLSFVRRGGRFDGVKSWWIEPYVSPDDGESWYLIKEPRINNAGNPATLTRLQNGDIALAYGWRLPPYGVRARISKDEGQTWSPERILRADGASWDIGYPRSIQRSDGKCVTIYYYHHPDQENRYIAATIWDPSK